MGCAIATRSHGYGLVRKLAQCAAALALLGLGALPAAPQPASRTVISGVAVPSGQPAAVPWTAGEYLEYTLKIGAIRAGSGRMQVSVDTLRGRNAWRLHFNVTGGWLFVRIDDSYDSWMDVETLNSLRFIQDLSELGGHTVRRYEIFPDLGVFTKQDKNGKEEKPTVENPLDDASFFFFVRSIPLVVGETYELPRYFDPKSNPVIVRVVRKDTVTVDAGKFPTIVLEPIIKTGGLFSKDGHAEIWLSDDNRRILVQMKTRIPVVGSLNLYLRKYQNVQEIVPPAGKRQ
jgi:uncharacterized protein DUF3108